MNEPDGVDRGPAVRVHRWSWVEEPARPPGLPWFGMFLVLLGLLILAGQVLAADVTGAAILLAAGLASLISWATQRGGWLLYLGAALTALGLADLLADLRVVEGPGWGTLFLGLAFLAIAALRTTSGGGWGWQLITGAILTLVGGSQVGLREVAGLPELSSLVLPLLLVALGAWLVLRATLARPR